MAEELTDRIVNNNLNDIDKEQLTNLVTPQIHDYKREETRERIRLKYNTDEECCQRTLKARLDYYYTMTADKENKRGRKAIYENDEEQRRISNESMKAKYHEQTN
eukprot:13682157-Heterocapsa_arctica.AAC.1